MRVLKYVCFILILSIFILPFAHVNAQAALPTRFVTINNYAYELDFVLADQQRWVNLFNEKFIGDGLGFAGTTFYIYLSGGAVVQDAKDPGRLVTEVEKNALIESLTKLFDTNSPDGRDLIIGNNSTIAPITATFDKKVENQADVPVTVTWNGNTLTAVKNGLTDLTLDSDYIVVGNTVTIKKEYLAFQPLGDLVLTFDFSAGEDATLTITIVDTTEQPDDSISDIAAELERVYPYIDETEKQDICDARDALAALASNPGDVRWDPIVEPLLTEEVENRFAAKGKVARNELIAFAAGMGDIYYATELEALEQTLRDFRDEYRDSFQILFGTRHKVSNLYNLLMKSKDEFKSVAGSYVDDLAFGSNETLVDTIPEVLKDAMVNALQDVQFASFRNKLSDLGWGMDFLIAQRGPLSAEVDAEQKAELALAKALVRSESNLVNTANPSDVLDALGGVVTLTAGAGNAGYQLKIMDKQATGLVDWALLIDGNEVDRIDESTSKVSTVYADIEDDNNTLVITPNAASTGHEISIVALRSFDGNDVDKDWILKFTLVVQ